MRKLLCVMLSVAMVLSLCACSADGNASSVPTVIYEEEVVYEETVLEDDVDSKDNDTSLDFDVSDFSSDGSTTPNPTVSHNLQSNEEVTYYLNNTATLECVKLNGRCDKTDNGISLNMAASAIEFNTDSTSVLLKTDADVGLFYTIMIDGEITVHHKEFEKAEDNYVVLARGLKEGSHNIKFIRDSESRTNMKLIAESIQLDDGAKLLPKDADKPIIEFLGDSLTSGYGNIVANGTSEPQSLKNQSSVKAYPFLLANKLGYDYRIVSMSGIALAKRDGYPSFTEFYSLESYHLDRAKKYISSTPEDVDIVIINLGTNDIGAKMYDVNNPDNVSAYKQHFAKLITDIGYRKDVKIIFVTGVWHKEPITAIELAIVELKNMGYNYAYSVVLSEGKSGGGAHPYAKEHQEYADKLEKFLKDNEIA